MVVDGATLSRILGTDAEPLLARLADQCSGVVVCRASPSQKAAIVRLMKVFQANRLRPVSPPRFCLRAHQSRTRMAVELLRACHPVSTCRCNEELWSSQLDCLSSTLPGIWFLAIMPGRLWGCLGV